MGLLSPLCLSYHPLFNFYYIYLFMGGVVQSATAGCGSRERLLGTSFLLPPTTWVLRQNSGFHAWLQHPWLLSHLTGPPVPPFRTFPVALPLKWPPCIVKQLRWVSEPVCVLGIPPHPQCTPTQPFSERGELSEAAPPGQCCLFVSQLPFHPLLIYCCLGAAPTFLDLSHTLYKRTTPGWGLGEMPSARMLLYSFRRQDQVPSRWVWVLACCSFAVQPREVFGMNPVHSTHHEAGLLVQGSCLFLLGSSSC